MFSRLMDINHLERKKTFSNEEKQKSEKLFEENDPPKKLAFPLEEDALEALRGALTKEKEEPISVATPYIPNPFLTPAENIHLEGITHISPAKELSTVFAKLVQTLIHIESEGISETTIFLDSDVFHELQGSRIVITEFSTAPKIFNIEFVGTKQSLSFFEPHAEALLNALHNKHLHFDVQRLDLSLLDEKEKYAIPTVDLDMNKEGKN